VGVEFVKEKIASGDNYMLIDARPHNKFLKGAIPSAINIPDTHFDDKKGMLPADMNTQLIFYCGGFKCKLSHKSAKKAAALDYNNVVVAEAGYPAWKEAYGASGAVQVQEGEFEGSIDPAEFQKIIAENPDSIFLVDVRDPDEFKAGHIPSSVNIPVDKLEKQIGDLPSDKPVVFACTTGARSGEAFYMIKDLRPELENVYYIDAEVEYKEDGTIKVTPHKK
jgi:rhodanese-related sulfurtransferase